MDRLGMAWHEDSNLPNSKAKPVSVRHAGFRGYVGESSFEDYNPGHASHSWDEDLWDQATPTPTKSEERHYRQHSEYPESYHDRHQQQYGDLVDRKNQEDTPDHRDDHLFHFISEHGSRADWEKGGGKLTQVDLRPGVYATQSHVAKYHINRYLKAPNDRAWYLQHGGEDDDYQGNSHPMFVTHQGRLHAIEGHHRIAAALARGDSHIQGWHYDLDKHPVGHLSDLVTRPGGSRAWELTDERCPDCEFHVADSRALAAAH